MFFIFNLENKFFLNMTKYKIKFDILILSVFQFFFIKLTKHLSD